MLLRLGGVAYSTQEGAGMTIEISSVDITTTMLFFVCVIVSKSMMSCRVSCLRQIQWQKVGVNVVV